MFGGEDMTFLEGEDLRVVVFCTDSPYKLSVVIKNK